MSVYRIVAPGRFVGLSTDAKPVRANESQVVAGATFYEYDTGNMYITYDGTNWVIKHEEGLGNLKTVSATLALNALNAYSINDLMTNSTATGTTFAFPAVTRINGGSAYITKASVMSETTAITPRLSMFLFNALPVGGTVRDNVLNLHVQGTDAAKFIGKIDWVALESLNSGYSQAIATPSTYGNLPIAFNCASGADDLYGILVTRDAVTQGTGDDITVALTIEQL